MSLLETFNSASANNLTDTIVPDNLNLPLDLDQEIGQNSSERPQKI